MENTRLSENVILVKLGLGDSKVSEELKRLNKNLNQNKDCDVVLDFTYVEIINSSNISNLMILRGLLEDQGRKLVLLNVQSITKCIFVVAGLSNFFNFVENLEDVKKTLQKETCTK